MIKINDYIFNENEIKRIHLLRFSTYTEIEVITNDRIYNCGTATFKGIEWNYGGQVSSQVEDTLKDDEYIELSNKYQRLLNRNEELEEENKTLKELNVCVGCDNNPDYKSRIDKAIKKLENMKNIKGGMNSTILQAINDVDNTINILKGEE